MKKYIIAGNWKMNMTASETKKLTEELNSAKVCGQQTVIICPPYTSLATANDLLAGSAIRLGAQNCHFAPKGAFTGEISIPMLKECGCEYVIIGHSERRQLFGESNAFINQKLMALLEGELSPILCIGETLDERQNGKTKAVLETQLAQCLKDVAEAKSIIIAYEPVWAIGTGISASTEQITETHSFIHSWLKNKFSNVVVPILYGGSVNDKNAGEILAIPHVDGALIGGASLVAEKFASIISTAGKLSDR